MLQKVELERGRGCIASAARSETHFYTWRYNSREAYVYEISDTFPDGYIVWNIGRENFPFREYIPIVKPHPDIPYHICTEGMMAFKCESEEMALAILHEACRKGVDKAKFLKLTNK